MIKKICLCEGPALSAYCDDCASGDGLEGFTNDCDDLEGFIKDCAGDIISEEGLEGFTPIHTIYIELNSCFYHIYIKSTKNVDKMAYF